MSDTQQKYFKQIGLSLFVLFLFSACVISITNKLTKDRIAQNQRQHSLKIVTQVMAAEHDNELLNDSITVTAPAFFGTDRPVIVYRARKDNNAVGVVFMPVMAAGYNGTIELAIGIEYDGTLSAVRVNRHRETEGLGDGIDHRKSDWIGNFNGRSLANTPIADWTVKKDGGGLDQLSGATISSRAVINAVKNTLDYYALNRDRLY